MPMLMPTQRGWVLIRLATYGFHMSFDFGYPNLGNAAMISALPVLIPLVLLLMRRIRTTGIQL